MHLFKVIGLTVAASFFSLPSAATPLASGGLIFPTGTTVAATPNLAGTVINDNLIEALFLNGFFAAGYDVQNRVVRSTNTDTLVFAPRIIATINNGFSENFQVLGFDLTGFGGFDIDADFRTDGAGDTGFSSISRSGDGDQLSFIFGPALNNGQLILDPHDASLFPSLSTNANAFDFSGTMTIYGRRIEDGMTLSTTITGLAAPSSDVPLPSAILLLLCGIGMLGITRRSRQDYLS